jgi:peptidoglycan/LPS O-acetylase OafA/YrhL
MDLSRRYISALTGLRGLAALWVIFFHLQYVTGFSYPLFELVFQNRLVNKGYLAVDIFFILSGFVMALTSAKWDGTKVIPFWSKFLKRRLARFYPVHVLTTLMMVVVLFASGKEVTSSKAVVALAGHLALVQAWGYHFSPDWNFPSWSLSAEWAAYLLFPFLLILNRKISFSRIFLSASMVLAYALLHFISVHYREGNFGHSYELGWLKCLCEFWIGLSLYEFHIRFTSSSSRPFKTLLFASAITGLILFCTLNVFDGWIVPISACLVAAVAAGTSVSDALFNSRFMQFLGRTSFSAYMLHVPVGYTFMKAWASGFGAHQALPMALLGCALTFVFIYTCSALVYARFEEPLRDRLAGRPLPRS